MTSFGELRGRTRRHGRVLLPLRHRMTTQRWPGSASSAKGRAVSGCPQHVHPRGPGWPTSSPAKSTTSRSRPGRRIAPKATTSWPRANVVPCRTGRWPGERVGLPHRMATRSRPRGRALLSQLVLRGPRSRPCCGSQPRPLSDKRSHQARRPSRCPFPCDPAARAGLRPEPARWKPRTQCVFDVVADARSNGVGCSYALRRASRRLAPHPTTCIPSCGRRSSSDGSGRAARTVGGAVRARRQADAHR